MNQRDKDIEHASKHYDIVNDHDDQLRFFADGAAYARTKFAHRLRTALEFQRKIDFKPSTIEVLEELIAELEKDA